MLGKNELPTSRLAELLILRAHNHKSVVITLGMSQSDAWAWQGSVQACESQAAAATDGHEKWAISLRSWLLLDRDHSTLLTATSWARRQ